MKRIRVSHLAERDLDEIWYYVAKNSPSMEIANGVVELITSHFLLLARTPEAGTRRDEIASEVRGFPVGSRERLKIGRLPRHSWNARSEDRVLR